jgi:hypothetical protein
MTLLFSIITYDFLILVCRSLHSVTVKNYGSISDPFYLCILKHLTPDLIRKPLYPGNLNRTQIKRMRRISCLPADRLPFICNHCPNWPRHRIWFDRLTTSGSINSLQAYSRCHPNIQNSAFIIQHSSFPKPFLMWWCQKKEASRCGSLFFNTERNLLLYRNPFHSIKFSGFDSYLIQSFCNVTDINGNQSVIARIIFS